MKSFKTSLITAVSAMAIMAAPAFADNETRATGKTPSAASDTNATNATDANRGAGASDATRGANATDATRGSNATGAAQMRVKADDLVGRNVTNAGGESIGDIESVIIDQSGEVAAVIVGVGGFLGIGEREVALDWNELTLSGDGGAIRTRMNKEQMTALPEYRYERPDQRRTAFVDPAYLDRRMETASNTEWVDARGMKASNLIGSEVINAQNETIGEVEDLVVLDGRTMLILSVGEFLGMGGHSVSMDLDKARIHQQRGSTDDLRVSVNMNKEQLKALPKYDETTWNQR
ncbi:MAG: PRC-barrel domain-containing protein [Alphaproteobacteria bacterium]